MFEALKDVGMPLSLGFPHEKPAGEERSGNPGGGEGSRHQAQETLQRPTHVYDHGAAYTGSWLGEKREGYGVQASMASAGWHSGVAALGCAARCGQTELVTKERC